MLPAAARLPLVGLILSSARRRSLMSAPIEVERKFEPEDAAQLRARIEQNGGALLGEKSFTDIYYDTAECSLTRRDMWLRSRDGAWELKLPVEEDARRSGGERTVFMLSVSLGFDISAFSFYEAEAEVLLPPGITFEVTGQMAMGNGLFIVQMRQVESPLCLLNCLGSGEASTPVHVSQHLSSSPRRRLIITSHQYLFIMNCTASNIVPHAAWLVITCTTACSCV